MTRAVTFTEQGRGGEERSLQLVEKELSLLRAQHRADVAELREESEISRAQLAALLAETKSSLSTGRAVAENSRFVLTLLILVMGVLFGGFLYLERQSEDELRARIANLQDQLVLVRGEEPVISALTPRRAADAASKPDIESVHVRRAPSSDTDQR